MLDELRGATADGAKALRWFETEVIDAAGDVVARMRKQLYIRREPERSAGAAHEPAPQSADAAPRA